MLIEVCNIVITHRVDQWFSNFLISMSLITLNKQLEPNGPLRFHYVPFVHSQSYRPIRVQLRTQLRNPECPWNPF